MNNTVVFYSNTKVDKNIKYLIKCDVEDNFCLIKSGTHLIALVLALEINRLRKESNINTFYSIEQFRTEQNEIVYCIDKFLQHTLNTSQIIVAQNFPFKLADELINLGYTIKPSQFDILPERSTKSDDEIKNIQNVLFSISECFQYIRDIIAQSNITKTGELFFKNTPVTSEYLRNEIENFCYQHKLIANNTIISCGKQSADPHCQGYGPIYANEFIVIDLFPYDRVSGYYADITRTFLKGQASAQQVKMYNTVKHAQKLSEKQLIPGTKTKDLMKNVLKFFQEQGYFTNRSAHVPYGMFHSLGHSFGLDIHEQPTLSNNEYILQTGNVITLEPGLYYPNIGGVRIEDDFWITDTQAINLSKHIENNWIID